MGTQSYIVYIHIENDLRTAETQRRGCSVHASFCSVYTLFFYSATHTAAIPLEEEEFVSMCRGQRQQKQTYIPVPTHILVTPIFLPVRLSSVNSVLTCRAPVQPGRKVESVSICVFVMKRPACVTMHVLRETPL